ncbi:sensor histidine kinase [Paludibaculum fermentans]|uniref:sensor histidine kinase n=1 Tax=Paludibaculum fermentans TaxID=1473598 RepID=UPI003EB94EC3
MRPRLAASAVLALTGILPAPAQDDGSLAAGYSRTHWGTDRGLPEQDVLAVAQASDGSLWIGTRRGVFRFDGMTFRPVYAAPGDLAELGTVLGLQSDEGGDIWVLLRDRRLLQQRHRAFDQPLYSVRPREMAVTTMSRGNGGTMLMSGIVNGLMRFEKGSFTTVAAPADLPSSPIIAIAQKSGGRIWVGTRDSGLHFLERGRAIAAGPGLPGQRINALAVLGKSLWIATDRGVARWSGGTFETVVPRVQASALLVDRESNVWIGTDRMLLQIDPSGTVHADASIHGVRTLGEDRHGSIWVGSTGGLDRLSPRIFSMRLPLPGGAIYADPVGAAWFAPLSGGLVRIDKDRLTPVTQPGVREAVVYSISSRGAGLWVATRDRGVARIGAEGTTQWWTSRDGLPENTVFGLHVDRTDAVWAATLTAGVSRLSNGHLTNYTVADGLASNSVSSIAESADGTVWFSTADGLSTFANGRWRTLTTKDGLPTNTVRCVFQDSGGIVWAGTDAGPVAIRAGSVRPLRTVPRLLRDRVFGITEDRFGWLWIATANHVLRIRRERLTSDSVDDSDVVEYGAADGLVSTEVTPRDRSIATDSSGRVWISTVAGLFAVDPARLAQRTIPPSARIEAISADGSEIPLAPSVRVLPERRRVVFQFGGVYLPAPERLRFRYRLDGFDSAWSEPTDTHEAVYTNLAPGWYRFRLAAGADELWSENSATVEVYIQPAWYQTIWFEVFAGLVLVAGLAGAYGWRLRVIEHRTRILIDERVGERTRVARELHDTLIQNITGLSLQIGGLTKVVTAPETARERLASLKEQAEFCLREARQSVWDLRSADAEIGDLSASIRESGAQLTAGKSARFNFEVEGAPRPISQQIALQLLRIAREGISNAAQHARATEIEARLIFESRAIRLVISDNGCGFEGAAGERPGHFGLATMRERAAQVGGVTTVTSSPGRGTMIETAVPTA